MRRNAVTATLTIGLAAAASVATVVSIAATAVAAPNAGAGTGLFASWHSAQSAAGFGLLRPTKTYGLAQAGKISVARCEISKKKAARRLVISQYGPKPSANLTISQNNSNGPCTRTRKGKALGQFRVLGSKAFLTGDCDAPHLPACSSRKIFLFLTWRKSGVYYQASSYGETRAVLLGFAKSLVRA